MMTARLDHLVPDTIIISDEVDDREIARVLQYWFSSPQGAETTTSGDYNFKYKWFPGSISLAQQRSVDAEVFTSFNSLFRDALERKLQHWQRSASGSVALIVVLDQFSRHICRHVGSMDQEQRTADLLALQASKAFFGRNASPEGCASSLDVMSLPMPQFVFALMPMRHASALSDLRFVLDKLKEKEECEEKHLLLLSKFRKQTTRQLQHLQDRALLEASDDILERHSFPCDESGIMQHPLVTALEQFLSRHLVSGPNEAGTRVPAHAPAIFSVVVSLSGGVDSMVISKILVLLRDNAPRLRIKQVLAVHIDYGNRPESAREAEYIETQWCADNGIQCRVRRIAEVTRGVTNRDQYEKESREIRYGFYRACLEETAAVASDSGLGLVSSGVIFGHHLGDVQENVLSNIMRGSSPLQLSGMTECSTANGVCVWRPLLRHTKDDIYSFAHRYGVPYFKDSTPSWSTRGKLRSSLLPLLLDMYGTGCLSNLAQLAEDSDRTRDLVQANLYDPFMSSIKRFPCGLSVDILPYRWQPQCFWREALKQLMHSMGMGMIRDKAVSNFVERIQRSSGTLQSGWLELRKGFHTLLKSDGVLIVIRDGCLGKFSDSSVLVNTPNTVNHRRQQLQLKAKQFHADPAVLPGLLSSLDSAFARLEADIHELLIFRIIIDDAFCSLDFDASLLNELIARDFSDSNSGQSSSTGGSVTMGSWSITIRPLSLGASLDLPPTIVFSVEDILVGRLSYPMLLPSVDTESPPSMVLLHQVEKIRISFGEVVAFLNAIGAISPVDDHIAKFNALVDGTLHPSGATTTVRSLLDSMPASFSGLESRFRFGIPILMPTTACSSPDSSSTTVKVQYSYSNVLPLI